MYYVCTCHLCCLSCLFVIFLCLFFEMCVIHLMCMFAVCVFLCMLFLCSKILTQKFMFSVKSHFKNPKNCGSVKMEKKWDVAHDASI